jgi:hypothetical protein
MLRTLRYRIAVFSLALYGCLTAAPTASHAQAANTFVRFVEEIGASRIGQAIAEEVVANSALARTVAEELGLAAGNEAQAAASLRSLTPDQWGAGLIQSDTLAGMLRSRIDTQVHDYTTITAAINTLRESNAGAEILPSAPTRSLLSLDLGSGEASLAKPIVLCENSWCEVKVEKFTLPSGPTIIGGAATAACTLATGCRQQLANWMDNILDRNALNGRAAQAQEPSTVDWIKCSASAESADDRHWCSLESLDLATVAGEGIYVIWHERNGTDPATVVSIGHGALAERLATERSFLMLHDYQRLGALRVTWASAATADADGIERYLVEKYHPMVTPPLSSAQPIAVNLPGQPAP